MLTIEGVVEEIIFRNENNGFTVGKLNTSDGIITIVGNVPFINLEEMVSIEGEWIYHNSFGEQFKFEAMQTMVPSTVKGIENYLASGLLPGIGPKTAEKIVELFGMDSLDIIQYNPEKLKEIPGIGDKKLEKIAEAFEEQRDLRDIMVYLQQYEISVNNGIKIYKKYGRDTIKVISENPYKLSEDVYGIGFRTADKIAEKMGISTESPYRFESGLKYAVLQGANDGHCYLPERELLLKTSELLQVEEQQLEDPLRELALRNSFYIIKDGDENVVYYMPYHIA